MPKGVDTSKRRYAITFGEVAILHVGGGQVGQQAYQRGFSVDELRAAKAKIEGVGGRAELLVLSDALPAELRAENEAATLVIRGGASLLLGGSAAGTAEAADALLAEQDREVSCDAMYWDQRRKRTLHKRARYNVVFGEQGREASADFQQFTIKAFAGVPRLAALRAALPEWLGSLAQGLNAEGNLYYEAASGIGFHGDAERKVVVCLSLGANSTLRYHWRLSGSSEHTFSPIDIGVRHGDVYVMSEKATECGHSLFDSSSAGSTSFDCTQQSSVSELDEYGKMSTSGDNDAGSSLPLTEVDEADVKKMLGPPGKGFCSMRTKLAVAHSPDEKLEA